MITLVLLVVLTVLLFATAWRQLPPAGQVWALIACLNTLLSFSLPTTAATSPWRPTVTRLLTASAALSLALLIAGLILHRRHAGRGRTTGWLAPLIISALPGALLGFFWLIGPLY